MADAGPGLGSFRDPAGFVFRRNGAVLRQINRVYEPHYERLRDSGLYASLVADGLLIPHAEVEEPAADPSRAWRVIRPEPLRYVSYPYEWCPGQLRDAALATLAIQQRAIEHGMSLRDASAYNIQFHRGRPLLIDTLSFERLPEGRPWVAYRQYCQHFLAPLALASRVDPRLVQQSRLHIDGIPLDLASRSLPFRTRFDPGLLTHVHLHAAWQQRHAAPRSNGAKVNGHGPQVSRAGLLGMLDSLESTTRGLAWEPRGTVWGDYYDATNYTPAGFDHKREVVLSMLRRLQPETVWDLGANTGVFSRIATGLGIPTLSFDFDAAAVEKNWRAARGGADPLLLPLLLDLTNPTPGIGWLNEERASWLERGPADAVLALALIHHLAIANNVPLDSIADGFARIARSLVIEFVPRDDSQVRHMLASREDIFSGYTREAFESAFGRRFTLDESHPVRDSARIIYRMSRRA